MNVFIVLRHHFSHAQNAEMDTNRKILILLYCLRIPIVETFESERKLKEFYASVIKYF